MQFFYVSHTCISGHPKLGLKSALSRHYPTEFQWSSDIRWHVVTYMLTIYHLTPHNNCHIKFPVREWIINAPQALTHSQLCKAVSKHTKPQHHGVIGIERINHWSFCLGDCDLGPNPSWVVTDVHITAKSGDPLIQTSIKSVYLP